MPNSLAPSGALAAVPYETGKLLGYWQTLPLRHRLRFLEGLPEAEALAEKAGEGGSGGEQGGDHLVRDLVLAPVAWCFKVRGLFPLSIYHSVWGEKRFVFCYSATTFFFFFCSFGLFVCLYMMGFGGEKNELFCSSTITPSFPIFGSVLAFSACDWFFVERYDTLCKWVCGTCGVCSSRAVIFCNSV